MYQSLYLLIIAILLSSCANSLLSTKLDYPVNKNNNTICPLIPADKKGVVKSPPGCFDYYVFSQFWLNELCINDKVYNSLKPSTKIACQNLNQTSTASMLAPHGLWPDFNNGTVYPAFCSREPLDLSSLPSPLVQQLDMLYTGVTPNLLSHEWLKHGTCSGKNQQQYFSSIIQLNANINLQNFIKNNVGKAVGYHDFTSILGGDINHYVLICSKYPMDNKQYISEIRQFFDKNLNPIPKASYQSDRPTCSMDNPIYIRKPAEFIDIKSYKRQFANKKAMNIGFDIDDTIWFSSAPFFNATNEYGHNFPAEFWETMNTSLDKYSIPKTIAQQLLTFHKERNDTIYFITARPKTNSETVTNRIINTFNLAKNINKVIFTGNSDKSKEIKQHNIAYYYGDADTDMTSAIQAGAIPVRIQRNIASTASSGANNGYFSEIVILDSTH